MLLSFPTLSTRARPNCRPLRGSLSLSLSLFLCASAFVNMCVCLSLSLSFIFLVLLFAGNYSHGEGEDLYQHCYFWPCLTRESPQQLPISLTSSVSLRGFRRLSFKYAWVVDNLKVEEKRRITIDITVWNTIALSSMPWTS